VTCKNAVPLVLKDAVLQQVKEVKGTGWKMAGNMMVLVETLW